MTQEYDRLQEFANAVLEQLPELGTSSIFCCELDFVWPQFATEVSRSHLANPAGL